MEFNRLISNVEPSKSVTLLAKTKELQKTDPEILNLTGGEPDFPTPKAVCDTVVTELAAGHTHYSDSRGDADLRARIARKLQEENHAPYQAENILITPGAKYAVYLTIRALINPGDEAIWLTPGWVSYPSIVEASGGKPVAVHLKYEENYRITEEALEAATISDLLAEEVDFFSIGTNDLTQYTLAIDRQNQSLDSFFDAHHIAVLRMINQTIQNAHKAGIWCGICGELGADSDLTELFLTMGIDELSVSPGRLLTIRRLICETDSSVNREEILKKWLHQK